MKRFRASLLVDPIDDAVLRTIGWAGDSGLVPDRVARTIANDPQSAFRQAKMRGLLHTVMRGFEGRPYSAPFEAYDSATSVVKPVLLSAWVDLVDGLRERKIRVLHHGGPVLNAMAYTPDTGCLPVEGGLIADSESAAQLMVLLKGLGYSQRWSIRYGRRIAVKRRAINRQESTGIGLAPFTRILSVDLGEPIDPEVFASLPIVVGRRRVEVAMTIHVRLRRGTMIDAERDTTKGTLVAGRMVRAPDSSRYGFMLISSFYRQVLGGGLRAATALAHVRALIGGGSWRWRTLSACVAAHQQEASAVFYVLRYLRDIGGASVPLSILRECEGVLDREGAIDYGDFVPKFVGQRPLFEVASGSSILRQAKVLH